MAVNALYFLLITEIIRKIPLKIPPNIIAKNNVIPIRGHPNNIPKIVLNVTSPKPNAISSISCPLLFDISLLNKIPNKYNAYIMTKPAKHPTKVIFHPFKDIPMNKKSKPPIKLTGCKIRRCSKSITKTNPKYAKMMIPKTQPVNIGGK